LHTFFHEWKAEDLNRAKKKQLALWLTTNGDVLFRFLKLHQVARSLKNYCAEITLRRGIARRFD
jgi:hypothetical protein